MGMKLLSPAGNMDSLRAAVVNGADEVYLGVGGFNARNNIDGFTLDSLEEAVDYAHVYGVRVCLAVNILFTDAELQEALDLVVAAYNRGVDAFIVQDLGLAYLLHTLAPDVVLHASTQMGVHNLEGVDALMPYGFRRFVLARETPLAEVRRIRDAHPDIEIEYFVQGALCVCFSGNCYLSERVCDASGNRGRCKQLCRLPYTLRREGVALKEGYLLSAKDFNMIDRLSELAAVGVDVLKIEGRARRPSYVAMTTAEYRRAIDGLPYDRDRLALAFNRLYTPGYLEGNGDVISPYPNHIGIAVGTVRRVTAGKRFDEVYFTSDRPLSPRSAFKFYVEGREESTVSAYDLRREGDLYRLTTTQKVSVGAEVRLISDAAVEEAALKATIRYPVTVTLTVAPDRPLTAHFEVEGQTYVFDGVAPSAALTQPLTREEFAANLDKSTLFAVTPVFEEFGDVFLPKKAFNEWRRQFFAYLFYIRTSPYKRRLAPLIAPRFDPPAYLTDCAVTRRSDEVPAASCVVYSPDDYVMDDVRAFAASCRASAAKPYLDMPIFAEARDLRLLRDILRETGVGVVANNYYALTLSTDVLVGDALNVANGAAAAALGYSSVANGVPYMTLRHCPIRAHVGGDCAHCAYREGYQYVMDNGKVLNLRRKRVCSCTFYLE